MEASLRLMLLLLCLVCSGRGQRVDLTLERDAMGADVVRSVLSKLDSAGIFNHWLRGKFGKSSFGNWLMWSHRTEMISHWATVMVEYGG